VIRLLSAVLGLASLLLWATFAHKDDVPAHDRTRWN
jgi:hypothetical protein